MAEKTKRPRRRRKSSRYLPLLWLITGALLAVVLVFSGHIAIDTSGTLLPNKTNTPSPSPATKETFSSLPSSSTSKTVSLYLARQLDKGVRLVSHPITLTTQDKILQATLQALIEAKSDNDLNLIPPDTKIRRVWVKDGYAHIDVSEEFAYNAYGIQGYKLQIYQIVLTACQFPSVKGVYFYLEGKPLRYLGGEGFPIPQPVLPPKEPFEIPY
ncbi:MAG: GerMN domain-containing protein [Brevinematales bacterium]|nr:GerMN domain-containing protein [Brevinematales bacterium]